MGGALRGGVGAALRPLPPPLPPIPPIPPPNPPRLVRRVPPTSGRPAPNRSHPKWGAGRGEGAPPGWAASAPAPARRARRAPPSGRRAWASANLSPKTSLRWLRSSLWLGTSAISQCSRLWCLQCSCPSPPADDGGGDYVPGCCPCRLQRGGRLCSRLSIALLVSRPHPKQAYRCCSRALV